MPASISLSRLSWSKPDGSPLFTDLDLTFGTERTGVVGRNGAGKSTLLRLAAGLIAPPSGQVTVSGTLAMMRQIHDPDVAIADLFDVRPALAVLDRAENGVATAEDIAEADWTLPDRMAAALTRCGLDADLMTPLASLSGGQQTRAALAAVVFAQPDILLMDEPTNNLDRAGRCLVIDLLGSWKGAAVVVSHDRELLEKMDAIVELTSLGASRYGGNYSAYRALKENELAAAESALAHAEKVRDDTALRAREAAERKARKDAAGRKSRVGGSQPKMFHDFEKNRAEASASAGIRLRNVRRAEAEDALTAARQKVEVLTPINMDVASTAMPADKTVLTLRDVSASYMPDKPVIGKLSLTITGPQRIVVSGPNGSGKTTLVKLITGQMPPTSGEVRMHVGWALLDQHLDVIEHGQSLRDTFLARHSGATTQDAHAALARFGFRADDALRDAGEFSGGERLRAGLACVLGGTPPPQLLILDEPTNHLDLAGLEALEAALAAYDGAVLAISHDAAFIHRLAPNRTVVLGPISP
ncbi:ABC-F family ATP-binding cassette domain-containing protein [Marivivens donghaensis]|uniref:ABC-F family ATP-binding cassette domain-containing protein n=1 Tax=Marivivens donghaensis TaxID=1699413 RepID=A0ABX0W016_9RHOB|nr:ABC-F family ATP-binding cassette domain-containing protein [Marivivens donghaensis]NIY73688.1 ABC-F family ATP-binding cassette domain-containing protein [Marivivens donghaensis]